MRAWPSVVILALLVSGITAFLLETELRWMVRHIVVAPGA
jgi:hypothetical protein